MSLLVQSSSSRLGRTRPEDAVASPRGTRRLAWRGLSILLDRRTLRANLLLLALVLAASLAYLCLGEQILSPADVLAALQGTGDDLSTFVVDALRLPRLGAALATGAAFALAGCLMQTLAANRLATPGIIGIDNGATAFAVASVVGLGVGLAPPAMALAGAATATALTFGLALGGGTQGYRFIVAGIGVGAVFGALTNLLLARVAIDVANAAYPWTVGSLSARPAGAVWTLAVGLAIGLPVAMALGRSLSLMGFSESVARSLGTRLGRRRAQVLSTSVVLTGLAVAVAGPVGMVGLLGPELARHLASKRSVPVLASALSGALIMVLADLAGRLMLSPLEIPVGIVTAVVGGPWLLWILIRPRSHGVA
ncbi:FecCD family ABC transporter permease [Halomonas caseinilytica]|uniref:FecCD family ABC transporter permease n=1 Tax=Halomonas caseinilytica TaxID=438744 RepID=UPI0007E57B18|nr:iron ABC transporter permease [Halomonas caseinilytica]SEM39547.1 iron complex transport system permease protein [Halomonas caseinilytica]